MLYEIRKYGGPLLWSCRSTSLAEALEAAIVARANLARANLHGASLDGADLARANLARANLARASLDGANLARANLARANLAEANLARANLARASLAGANLVGANLHGANLHGATLDKKTIIPTGETWEIYLDQVVPELLVAGGKTIEQVIESGAWNKHSWCDKTGQLAGPMAVAFGIKKESEVPILLWPRMRQFVQFFDAKLIPCPVVPAKA